ncbi:pyocin activator PrtN family protein [Actibacterium lipolyticum]|uniref:Pyocin activator protein PrtN n=1 Tax=Actibacterium lipolyticum TaxID=1524263 RepID=A0A238JUX4_9RHOB|nr:pyocin activator PrtN family protein [Actibacterium lipolyticum]SMX34395.1 Pyocin activator protein PrtN [Actibacterium lipolyticum]
MNTAFMLMSMYNARVMIPSEQVARDWFDLTKAKFHEKIRSGEIQLPLMSMEDSQKSPRGVHILDLASYIDQRRGAASK